MSDQESFEATFVQHIPLIDRVTSVVARRHGLNTDEATDLASWIKLKLVENEYAAFRKFRGESSMGTYLAVVVAMLARDYRVHRWGRWRPSAAARRRGDVAVRLETLIHRKGMDLRHAAEILRSSGATELNDRELANLLSQLPVREPLRPIEVGAEPLASVPTSSGAEIGLDSELRASAQRETEAVVQRMLSELPVEDRIVLRMRFWEDMSVADIARGLHVEQKPLYRRLERLLSDLRDRLTRSGVTRDRLDELLNEAVS